VSEPTQGGTSLTPPDTRLAPASARLPDAVEGDLSDAVRTLPQYQFSFSNAAELRR
jgi:hypothetical protein